MPRKKSTQKPINPRDFEGQEDSYILDIVTEDMERALKFQAPYFRKFANFYRLYNSVMLDSEKRPNGANLFIPYIYNIVETSIPKILGSVLDSKPFISYKPVGDLDLYKGEKMTMLVDFQLRQYMKAATRLYEIFKSSTMYGTAISKQIWKYETKTVTRRKMAPITVEMDDGTMEETEALQPQPETIVTYDAPNMQNIPLEAFFFDPAYTDIDPSPWVCHEYWMELYELQAGAEGKDAVYKNVKSLTTAETQGGPLADRLMSTTPEQGNMRDGVRIWEYWTNDWKVMVANKTTVVQCIPNPYYHKKKPFVKWVLIPMPNEFYGKPPIEALEDLQAELNTTRSQRIDNVSLALNKMFIINRNAQVDTAQLVSRPNGWIEVDNVEEDIKEMTFSDVTSSAYKEEEIIKEDMDVTSGVHNYDRGQQGDRKDTATVANLLTSASSERFKLQVMMMEEDPMNELGKQLAELNKQFLDGDVWVRITQDDGTSTAVPVSFEDIDTEYDIISVGTAIEASVNKEVRQAQLVQLFNMASQLPEVNRPELVKAIFKEFDMKDIENLILTPEQQAAQMPVDGAEQIPGMATTPGMGVGGLASYAQNPMVQAQ